MADPYKDNVVLYLPMEGSRDGDTVILDKTGKTVMSNGNVHLSTDVVPPFGTTSCYFDGTDDYLQFLSSSAFDFKLGDFTIEAWLYRTANTSYAAIAQRRSGTETYSPWGFGFGATSNTLRFVATSQTSAYDVDISTAATVSASQWVHVAAVRFRNAFTIYIDGVVVATATSSVRLKDSTSLSFSGTNNIAPNGSNYYTGYIKDLRITSGVARYTGNFYVDQEPFEWDEPEQPRIFV